MGLDFNGYRIIGIGRYSKLNPIIGAIVSG